MNILVTGANGQLGQCLKWIVEVNKNGERDHYVGDKNCYIFKSREELDISNLEEVRKTVKQEFINVIVNCAAYTNVNKAQEEKELAHLVNNVGAMNLAIAASETGAVLIHISTDYVFSVENKVNTPLPPFNFSDPFKEIKYKSVKMEDNYYGFSKLNAEDAIIRSNCKYIILRTSWLYSWFGKNFVKTMFDKIVNGEDVKVVYDQVGSPTSAHELAKFIYHIIEKHGPNTRYLSKCGIYNFVENGVASWYDIVEHIKTYLQEYCELQVDSMVTPCLSDEFKQPVKRPNYSVLDNHLTKEAFNYDIKYWEKSLNRVIYHLWMEYIENEKPNEKIKKTLNNFINAIFEKTK